MTKYGEPNERSMWVTAGVFGALGVEYVSLIVGGVIVGNYVDEQFGTQPAGVLVMIGLGTAVAGYHTYRMVRKFMKDEANQ